MIGSRGDGEVQKAWLHPEEASVVSSRDCRAAEVPDRSVCETHPRESQRGSSRGEVFCRGLKSGESRAKEALIESPGWKPN